MEKVLLDFLAGERQIERQGYQLRLLSAWELMQANAEAQKMAGTPETAALRSNAAILSRAVVKGHVPVFSSAEAVLHQWSAERIGEEMTCYRRLRQQLEPDWADARKVEALRDKLGQCGRERLRWKVLCHFGVLPSEARAREMTENDYLYCAMQMMLDREEQLEQLCPQCRSRVEHDRCSGCGRELEGAGNPAFDPKRFEELKRGG